MKMRLTRFLAFVLLSISILSFGISDVAFATNDPNPALPISSDLEIYSNGSSVTVSGTVRNYDSSTLNAGAVTYIVMSPTDGFVTIGQMVPNSDGSFEFNFIAGGILWKANGDYTVGVKYGADSSKVTISYVGADIDEPVISKEDPSTVDPSTVDPPTVDPPTVDPPTVDPPTVDPPTVVPPTVVPPTVVPPTVDPTCGAGTELVDGICKVKDDGGACLIATAAYGTELAPQVQLLREIRDNTLFSTSSGTAFMGGFNTLYYSFAPTVADLEREHPMFKEIVKTAITPMLSTLSIMSLADEGSEADVLGLGISVIALNLGMYIAAPALIGFKVNQIIKSRK